MSANLELSTVKEILGGLTGTTDQQLASLFEKFNIAARAIDTSISGSWVGYDADRPNTPTYIIFERHGSAFFGRRDNGSP